MVLASASVGLGLAMAARIGGGRLADRRVLHEALSIAVMIAIVVHAGSLLFDHYVNFGLADVTVPFASGYQTLWTTLGIVSGWGIVLFGLAYYARDHIGRERWKLVHRLTLVTWIGGLVHSLGEGTDAGQPWFVALMALVVAPSLILLAVRVTSAGRAPAPAASPPGSGRLVPGGRPPAIPVPRPSRPAPVVSAARPWPSRPAPVNERSAAERPAAASRPGGQPPALVRGAGAR